MGMDICCVENIFLMEIYQRHHSVAVIKQYFIPKKVDFKQF